MEFQIDVERLKSVIHWKAVERLSVTTDNVWHHVNMNAFLSQSEGCWSLYFGLKQVEGNIPVILALRELILEAYTRAN